jgi:transcriptional regulator with XRE-family HTH domain
MATGSPRLRSPDGKLNQVHTRVRERRDTLGITQDALCGRIARLTDGGWNPDRMEVYRIEAGMRIVSDLELLALARALECSAAWLLVGNGPGESPAPTP